MYMMVENVVGRVGLATAPIGLYKNMGARDRTDPATAMTSVCLS